MLCLNVFKETDVFKDLFRLFQNVGPVGKISFSKIIYSITFIAIYSHCDNKSC